MTQLIAVHAELRQLVLLAEMTGPGDGASHGEREDHRVHVLADLMDLMDGLEMGLGTRLMMALYPGARLAGADLARIVMSVRALPAALPTRISLSGDDHLVLASGEESVVTAMRSGDVISVEIDGLEDDGSVWSVMVSGIATAGAGDETLRPAIREAIDHGANLLSLPLTVVSGQRSH